jgi:SAM-dependent methyltransferase
MTNDLIYNLVSNYYTNKITAHGPTAQGVDWNSIESQQLRFEQLLKVCDHKKNSAFSLLDYGCGYGALYDYIASYKINCNYIGYDWSSAMVAEANKLHPNFNNCQFIASNKLNHNADFVVSSGIFNVKFEIPNSDWQNYVLETIHTFATASKSGFAFNMLTSYSDKEYMRPDLYYGDPLFYFDYCKKHFSRSVSLLHDYNLYEFTVLVRQQIS